jgi:hypothetical protein
MKSNPIVTFFKHPLTALFAVCLLAGSASAQSAIGHFRLPFEAKWGQAVLPPGNYSFSIGAATMPDILILRNEQRDVALIVNTSRDTLKASQDNALIFVRHGNERIVRALKLGSVGATYNYPVPKAKGQKPSLVAETPQLLQRIPVTVAGE